MKSKLFALNFIHIFNDGFESSFLLLLPFIQKDLHFNLTYVGLIGTLVTIIRIILSIPSGYWSTRFGGMKVIIYSTIFYALGFLGVSVSNSLLNLVLVFILGGLGYGIFHTIGFSLVARLTDKKIRGREMGNFTATGDLGRIGISSILTFIVVIIGWRFTSLIYAFISFLLFLYFILKIKSKNDTYKNTALDLKELNFIEILKNAKFIFALLTSFFDNFASVSLFIFLPFLLLKRNINPSLLGSFTAAFFVGNFLGKFALGRFIDKHGSAKIFIIAETLMAIFIFLLGFSTSFIFIIIFAILLGIFTKGTLPITETMLTEAVEEHGNFEKAHGINGIVTNLGVAIAPLLLGYIADNFGIIWSFNIMAIGALIAILPAIFFNILYKPTH